MFRQRLLAWLYSGADRTRSFSLRRKVLHANAVAFLAILFMASFDLAYLFTGNIILIQSIGIHIPVFVFAAMTPTLNRKGHHNLVRWGLALLLPGMVGLTVGLVSGSYLSLHYIFIVIAMITVALFPLRESFEAAVLVVFDIAAFGYCEYNGVLPHPSLYTLSDATVVAFQAGYIGTMIFTVLFVAWLGEYSTEQNELELESLSGIDPLTQLPNRRRIMQRLAEGLIASKRLGEYGGVLFLDVDNFKVVNDVHGHESGDLLLQEVARRLNASIRKMEMAARLGGDEFVVVLSHLGRNRDEARANLKVVSQTISAVLAQPYQVGLPAEGNEGLTELSCCSCSIGATLFDGADVSPDAILQRADAAMYAAKAAGKNRVQTAEEYVNLLSS